MTTFEEDVIECYYNSMGYFTIKNYNFPAAIKRKGGKGRGEIDLIALKLNENSKLEDVHAIEIKFSITNPFPWDSPVDLLVKKFIKQDIEVAIKKLIGKKFKPSFYLVAGIFNPKTKEKLIEYLEKEIPNNYEFQELRNIKESYEKYRIRISAENFENAVKTVDITIIDFQEMLKYILNYFKEENLHLRNYTDPRMRSISQYVSIFEKIKRSKSNTI